MQKTIFFITIFMLIGCVDVPEGPSHKWSDVSVVKEKEPHNPIKPNRGFGKSRLKSHCRS